MRKTFIPGIGFLLVVLSTFNVVTLAQKRRSSTLQHHAALPQSPFNAGVDELPPNFQGNDAKLIYINVASSKLLAPKSEFETTSVYKSRIASFPDSSIAPGLSASSLLSFVFGPSEWGIHSLEASYDADKSEYVLKVSPTKTELRSDSSPLLIDLLHADRQSSEYIGSNAFGASAQVAESSEDEYDLDVAATSWFLEKTAMSRYMPRAVIEVGMPPSEAEKRKGFLRFLFIGHVDSPWSETWSDSLTPTVDSPIDHTTNHKILPFHVKSMWVFDVRTGEILKKIDEPTIEAPALSMP